MHSICNLTVAEFRNIYIGLSYYIYVFIIFLRYNRKGLYVCITIYSYAADAVQQIKSIECDNFPLCYNIICTLLIIE